MPEKEIAAPLFRFSRYLAQLAILALSCFLGAIILGREQGPLGKTALTLGGFLLLFSIAYGFYLPNFFRSIREARFYESHFTVRGWRVNRRVDYNNVEAVVNHRSKSLWITYTTLRIFVKGDAKPLVIPRIPKSRRLQTDLYSWLSSKVLSLHAHSSVPSDSQSTGLLSSEEVLCVVSSSSLTRNGESYSLVVMPSRIIGSSKSTLVLGYGVYLGPGSQATPAERQAGRDIAQGIMKAKDLELSKDSILQIGYQAPGVVSVGYLIFRTTNRDFAFNLGSPVSEAGFKPILACLLKALIEFAPSIIRDEKSGALITISKL
jgi:hypothetical protein